MKSIRLLLVIVVAAAAIAVAYVAFDNPDDALSGQSILNRGLGSDPESLDPQKARSVQSADVIRDIGEGLFGYTASGQLVLAAADSSEMSGDGLTVTFHIRPEARWSNGDPLTAADFVLGLQRLVDPLTAATYATELSPLVNAEAIIAGKLPVEELGVEAVNDRTLVISLSRPIPYLERLLTHPSTFPVHRGSVAEHGDMFSRAGNLLSNGAYRLERWEPGSMLELHRNEHYWNSANTAIDVVRHHVVAQEMAEFNRYRAGELHTTSNVPPDSFQQARKDYGDQLHVGPSLGVYYYGFNLTRPPFAGNPALRQALSMAVDREAIVTGITGRGETPAYSWVRPGVANYDPPRLPYADLTQEQRDALSQSLFREAGYGPNNPLRFELRYNTSDVHKRIAAAVQDMWRKTLGVEVELVNVEFRVLLEQMKARDETQLFLSSWFGDYDDANSMLSIMTSGSSGNWPGFSNDEFDSQMEAAGQQTDLARRRLYLEEAERVLLDNHAVIPVYFYVSKHLVHPDVEGWEDNILDYHYSQHLSLRAAD